MVASLLVLTGCSSGDYDPVPSPATAPAPTTVAAEVTLRGAVAVFSASARVITLAQPVGGIANVTVSNATEVVRAGGTPATVGDLAPGVPVEVTGRPSTPGTLVARRVVLL